MSDPLVHAPHTTSRDEPRSRSESAWQNGLQPPAVYMVYIWDAEAEKVHQHWATPDTIYAMRWLAQACRTADEERRCCEDQPVTGSRSLTVLVPQSLYRFHRYGQRQPHDTALSIPGARIHFVFALGPGQGARADCMAKTGGHLRCFRVPLVSRVEPRRGRRGRRGPGSVYPGRPAPRRLPRRAAARELPRLVASHLAEPDRRLSTPEAKRAAERART